MYTLTASNSRTKVWLAKLLAISVFAVLYTLLMAIVSPLFAYMGAQLAGNEFASQTIYYRDILWKVLTYGWGYSMLAFIFATIIRNQIGALATIFIVPSVVEGISGLLLKENAKYLPFASLNVIASNSSNTNYAPITAAGVLVVYIAAGWLISWVLFLKRDAN
jgi:ABC-type transport system involved in multi-copper enzyme maturation permease subunit